MPLQDIRQRSGYLFLAVVLAQIILISAQVNSRTGVPVLEAVTFGIFAEVQRTASAAVSGVRRVWSGYIGLRHAKTENDDLKRQLASAQIQLQELRALADRSRGLEQLLQLRDRSNLSTTAAEIIGDAALITATTAGVLDFASWLEADAAGDMEHSVDALRARGMSFAMTVSTLADRIIEASTGAACIGSVQDREAVINRCARRPGQECR